MKSCIVGVGVCSKHSEDGNALERKSGFLSSILQRPLGIGLKIFNTHFNTFYEYYQTGELKRASQIRHGSLLRATVPDWKISANFSSWLVVLAPPVRRATESHSIHHAPRHRYPLSPPYLPYLYLHTHSLVRSLVSLAIRPPTLPYSNLALLCFSCQPAKQIPSFPPSFLPSFLPSIYRPCREIFSRNDIRAYSYLAETI